MRGLVSALVVIAALVGCDRAPFGKASSERAETLYRSAMAEYQAGRLEKAIVCFEKALGANPLNASARFQLACLKQDSKNDYLGALIDYKEFLRLEGHGDKADMALSRLKRCEELLFSNVGSQAQSQEFFQNEIIKLKEENVRLTSLLAEVEKRYLSLSNDFERTKKFVSSVGVEDEVAPPAKFKIPKGIIAENDEADAPLDISQAMKELKALKEDEASVENVEQPFNKAVASKKPVSSAENKKAATPEKPATYTIKDGDTLISVARRFYGHGRYWRKIQEANRSVVSVDGKVRAGMEIILP